MTIGKRICRLGRAVIALAMMVPVAACAADESSPLAVRESELLARYLDLERAFLRLADLLDASDPRRAAVLRATFERAREEQVGERVAAIVGMLEQGQLLKAGTSQQDAIAQMRALLDLLESGAGDERLADTRKEVRAFLARVAALIARQRDVEAATETNESTGRLAGRQEAVADEARGLDDDLRQFADRLSPVTPPTAGPLPESADEAEPTGDDDASRAGRTGRRVAAAEARMRQARAALDASERGAARGEQERAVEELETARAELEEILRQVREEEVTRLLVQLDARIRGMLKAERTVQADAEKVVAASGVQGPRERQLETARIGRDQQAITTEASRAITLVRDDGSAVAIPEALEQVRDDSSTVAARLARGDVGPDTRALVGEIVVGLEELLAAVERAQQASQREQAAGAGGGGQAGEQPLVDKLSELRMLRALQARVNARTKRLATLIDVADGDPVAADNRAVLSRLVERQRAIEQAARDIVEGMTE